VPETATIKQLLEAGTHFGHQTSRWHPRMKSYIFTKRNGIHIIDLQQTASMLEKACDYIQQVVAEGGSILFVGTKKQAQETIEQEAQRCGMYYVNNRWLGGVLTNFTTIQARIDHLVRLENQQAKGDFGRLPKRKP
jgi:small subunit ribosomal protein S2